MHRRTKFLPGGRGVLLVWAKRAMMMPCLVQLDDNLRIEKKKKMLVLRTHSTPTKDEHKHKSGRQYFTVLKTLSEKKAENLIVGLSHHPPPPSIDCQRWGAELCFLFLCCAEYFLVDLVG